MVKRKQKNWFGYITKHTYWQEFNAGEKENFGTSKNRTTKSIQKIKTYDSLYFFGNL